MITIETEKAAMDVPAPGAGRIAQVKVKKGDKVSEGSLILLLEDGGEGQETAAAPSAADAKPAAETKPAAESTPAAGSKPAAESKPAAAASKPAGGDKESVQAAPAAAAKA